MVDGRGASDHVQAGPEAAHEASCGICTRRISQKYVKGETIRVLYSICVRIRDGLDNVKYLDTLILYITVNVSHTSRFIPFHFDDRDPIYLMHLKFRDPSRVESIQDFHSDANQKFRVSCVAYWSRTGPGSDYGSK